jgi:hypothetical protein
MNSLLIRHFLPFIFITAACNVEALEATKASQLVDLAGTFSSSCPAGISGAIEAANVVLPDGTSKVFEIPNKKVLVITSAELLITAADPNVNIQSRIFKAKDGINEVSIQEKLSDNTGRAQFNYVFPSGVVIAKGGHICANSNTGSMSSIFLHGFLATAN